ncbi:Ent-kaurene oxidase [Lasiodiplodia hormozganensis]|uniref:Ent-kaurene oxidase n=1 Tax=Lasiodiplodia hormozganensis TaxID=869390 RepID=A0AA39Y3C8_9PEZI|nr:Ent-kaurene oxidase [Lasiodiplodia hormozganensis]
MLDEIRKAPDTHLSQPAQAEVIFQMNHTLHHALSKDLYHFDVVRKKLMHALSSIIPDLIDETLYSLDAEVGTSPEWVNLPMYPVASKVVTRVANRMMVGLALCRNDEFLHYSGAFTKATFDAAAVLRNLPEMMKPLLMRFMTDHRQQQAIARKYLVPIIRQRIAVMERKTAEKAKLPNDSVTWLLELTPPEKRDPEILLQRLIHINVTSIHAPAVTLTECIYDLCRHPEIHEELRTEIDKVLGNNSSGSAWTKANVDRLVKLDSFIRESARMTPMSAVKMERLAIQDFRFSDGTLIPKGTCIGVISHGRHMDENLLPKATEFDAFRFARMRTQPQMENMYTFAQASPDNLLFGLGRHACPGRHFASVLLKIVLVEVLVQYDIKFIEGRPLPQGKWTQKFRNPDMQASIAWKLRPVEDKFSGILR